MGGTVLLIQTADQGNGLTVQFMRNGAVVDTVKNIGAAAKMIPVNGFDGFTIAGAAGTVQGVVTAGDIDIQLSQVGTLITNGDAQAVPIRPATGQHIPVDVMSGNINMTATNVGILQGGTITENAPVAAPAFTAATPNQVSLLAAAAGRRRVAFKNAGTGIAYIGGAGVTPTNAVISLSPGDVWHDNDGAPAAWYGTSDAGTTINVQVMA
ncbi:hypothetical protein [Burkholderia territorii]|uniref:hypothetical protein n=1 Tax=Burkholderia territorii TaxID=1503055 RepID=UPI0012DAACF9|nr:hypothetical protein [Burkholderia territorii]